MNILTQHLNKELREALLPLAKDCPLEHCNPQDCPLYLVRKMKPRQRWQWFEALSEEGLTYLAAYHHVCLNTKLAATVSGTITGSRPQATSVA